MVSQLLHALHLMVLVSVLGMKMTCALQVCLTGSRQFNTFGSHGAAEFVTYRHFTSLQECCTCLKSERGMLSRRVRQASYRSMCVRLSLQSASKTVVLCRLQDHWNRDQRRCCTNSRAPLFWPYRFHAGQ